MEVMTIRDYAKSQGVSYEAVRKQIAQYADDLHEHIIIKGRTKFLDEWAINFLSERRRENPVILIKQDRAEEIEFLRAENAGLKAQLFAAQNELLKTKDRVIALQDDVRLSLEAKAKYDLLLTESSEQVQRLQRAEAEIDALRAAAEKQHEEDEAMKQQLQTELDAARADAGAYTKSWFGLYRRKKS